MDKSKIQKSIKLIIFRAESLSLALGLAMLVVCLAFLYNNFCRGVSDINVLSKIKGQVAIKVINMQLWEQVREGDALKKQGSDTKGINNPF